MVWLLIVGVIFYAFFRTGTWILLSLLDFFDRKRQRKILTDLYEGPARPLERTRRW